MTVWDKVLVKNLTPEDVRTGFTNIHVVDQQIEKASNVTDEEEIMKIAPVQAYLIYYGFEKYLDEAMVYERINIEYELTCTEISLLLHDLTLEI